MLRGSSQGATSSTHLLPRSYTNVTAYDHSRVRLTKTPTNHFSGYINANWVGAYGGAKSYIATQGPVPDSIHE